MSIIRWALITLLLLALVGFMGQNQDELVDVKFFFWQTPRIELAYALFIAFGAGVILHMLFSMLKQIQLHAEISRLKKQIRRLHDELEQLRNLAIEEELFNGTLTDAPGTLPGTDLGPFTKPGDGALRP
jgi:uncharacterized integral membrane protein